MFWYGLLFFTYSCFANLSTWCLVVLFQSSFDGIGRCAPVASLDASVLILMLFCLSLLIEITKSIVGHFNAVPRDVFVIKTSVFIIIAFNRTPCHKMLIYSSMVNVSWLYLLIPAYTQLPLIAYPLLLTSYRLLLIK